MAYPGVGPDGRLRRFAHFFCGGVCRGLEHYPAFAPSSSQVAVRFLVFLYLVVHNLPQLYLNSVILFFTQLFLIPYSSCFVA